jgi:RNA polymerase sigma-B factor
MSRDDSPRSRAALADATDHREREAADLRAYADHRKPRARERLIRSYLPLANSIARRFDRGQRVPLEDLQQIAAIGLLKALDRYDPAHGAAFSTFAVPTMEGEILRYFRDFTWTVRPPRELQERAIRIEPEREQLTNDLGRSPTARELAAQVGCTPEELLDASEAAHARSSDSFARPVTTQEGDAATLGERLGDEDPGFEAAEASATLDRLLNTLSERDQLVLRLRFRDDLTQTEIARRIGCSQMHVSPSSAPPLPNSSRTRPQRPASPTRLSTTPDTKSSRRKPRSRSGRATAPPLRRHRRPPAPSGGSWLSGGFPARRAGGETGAAIGGFSPAIVAASAYSPPRLPRWGGSVAPRDLRP